MATKWAVATGNWSSSATWDGGVVPSAGDYVYANGFTVTVDQDITVAQISTQPASGIVAGGGFTANSVRTLTCDISAGTTPAFRTNGNFAYTVIGNVFGGTASNANGIWHDTGSGTLTITGSVTGGSNGSAHCIRITSNGLVTINGNVYGGSIASSRGISKSSGLANITVNGEVYGKVGGGIYTTTATVITVGTVTGGTTGVGIEFQSGSLIANEIYGGSLAAGKGVLLNGSNISVTVSNQIVALGAAVAIDMNNSGGCTVSTAYIESYSDGSIDVPAVSNTNRLSQTSATTVLNTRGFPAVTGRLLMASSAPSNFLNPTVADIDTPIAFFVGTAFMVAPEDVRLGVSYFGGELEGVLAIPSELDVKLNVGYGANGEEFTGLYAPSSEGGSGITTDDWDLYFSGFPKMRPIEPINPTGTGEQITVTMLAAYYAQFPCSNPLPMSSFVPSA